MKKPGRILIIIGIVLIVLNLFAYTNPSPPPEGDKGYVIAYYIGFNLFLLVGLILLIIGLTVRSRAKKKSANNLVDELFRDESNKNSPS